MSKCLSCPRGEKRDAEYFWHPGSVGVHPLCEMCLRDSIPDTADDLRGYAQTKYEYDGPNSFVAGYATPIGAQSPQIVVEENLDSYLEAGRS